MGVTKMAKTLERSDDIGLPLFARGKVRDIYDLGDKLLLVVTDRISAFDVILDPPIPEKGRLLTQISAFWFKHTQDIVPNHMISSDLTEIQKQLPEGAKLDPALFEGRCMLVKKAKRIDAECVVRGFLAGSGWKEYQESGKVCGHTLPEGLELAQELPGPIFTPATKADEGHDENISRETLADMIGTELAEELEEKSIALYKAGLAHAKERGLILADTKFEFGFIDGKVHVIDEMLTPDAFRFWEASEYEVGKSPQSFDNQFVRDHLEKTDWDKTPPAPSLPAEVVEGTTARYREALERLTR